MVVWITNTRCHLVSSSSRHTNGLIILRWRHDVVVDCFWDMKILQQVEYSMRILLLNCLYARVLSMPCSRRRLYCFYVKLMLPVCRVNLRFRWGWRGLMTGATPLDQNHLYRYDEDGNILRDRPYCYDKHSGFISFSDLSTEMLEKRDFWWPGPWAHESA